MNFPKDACWRCAQPEGRWVIVRPDYGLEKAPVYLCKWCCAVPPETAKTFNQYVGDLVDEPPSWRAPSPAEVLNPSRPYNKLLRHDVRHCDNPGCLVGTLIGTCRRCGAPSVSAWDDCSARQSMEELERPKFDDWWKDIERTIGQGQRQAAWAAWMARARSAS